MHSSFSISSHALQWKQHFLCMCFTDCSILALKHWKPSAAFYMAFFAILKFISVFVSAEQNDTLFLAKFETRDSLWPYDNAWTMTFTSNIYRSTLCRLDVDLYFIHHFLSLNLLSLNLLSLILPNFPCLLCKNQSVQPPQTEAFSGYLFKQARLPEAAYIDFLSRYLPVFHMQTLLC